MMIAPQSSSLAYLVSLTGGLPKPIVADIEEEGPTAAQTLANLYRRCGRGGGCPYTLDQLLNVLSTLRYHGRAEARELARDARLPASATYGCLLEAEDYGLSRWIPRPVYLVDHQTAEITLAGSRLLRAINTGGDRHAG